MTSLFLSAAGERYADFVVTKCIDLKELQCTLRELLHLPSGAQIMHLENEDPENLFCLSFKTLPGSSNGAAHILEHTVLCGSRKYPVKDPFFAMNRRSLNTFMNALTGADFTCYPASSQVEKDFYNLLDVYIDAVFHPLLNEESFLQEGHRLEFVEPTNPNSALTFKGIVYNEMKGSMSAPDTRLWHELMAALVPDLPYAFNSGGDPEEIPSLTYAELISFYEQFYHPSRCLFFFYGNLPLKKHLDVLAEKALKNVPKEQPLPPIPRQKRFADPVHRETSYPISEKDLKQRTFIAFGWLTAPLIQQDDVIALTLLDAILMDTDASPLKMALLDSELCTQADAFLDTEMSEVPYAIICKGCERENSDKLEGVLKTALLKIIDQGIPEHLIDAALHQLELNRTEITGDQSPFGLSLFMRSALAKQHGCQPENALMVHALFENLLARTKDPQYLTEILRKYLLENRHFVRVIMVPDPDMATREVAAEKTMLAQMHEKLTLKEAEHLVKQAKRLADYQKLTEHQTIDCLPKVTLQDVPVLARNFSLHQIKEGNLQAFHHSCFTNHILYADLIFDLPHIAAEDLSYLHLFTTLLPEIGSAKRNYAEQLEYIQAHTGGIAAFASLHVQAADPHLMRPSFTIRGKALERKVDKLFPLIKDILTTPHFEDKERMKELILQIHTSLQNRIVRNALRYASQLALSGYSVPGYLNNALYGLPYYKTIDEIAHNIDANVSKVIDKMLQLKEQVLSLINPQLVLSCDQHAFDNLAKQQFYALGYLLPKPTSQWTGHYALPLVESQARIIAAGVAYNVEAFKSISYLNPHAPALTAASYLMENKFLHAKIREKGGAYGCGATFAPMNGFFTFHSFRDPHITSTFDAFHDAVKETAAGHFDEKDLEEAKLGVIQQFDSPIAPGTRALTAYTWLREGKTLEMRQHFRDTLLALTHKDVQHVAEKELATKFDKSIRVSFAGKELLEKDDVGLPISLI